MLTNSFASTRSRDTRGFRGEDYDLRHVEAQASTTEPAKAYR
jgi:hypothetical protein